MSEETTTQKSTEQVLASGINSAQEVEKMKNSDIKYRAKYKETVAELEGLKAAQERKEREAQEKMSALEKEKASATQKRIDAEIKAAAVEAGLTDLDLIKLMDKEKVSIDSSGELVGVAQLVEDFKTQKPSYFTEPKKTSSSTNAEPVKSDAPKKIDWHSATPAEIEAERRRITGMY